MTEYEKIELTCGISIEEAIKELSLYDGKVCCDFNGKTLYSDVDNIETAYVKITGRTRGEFREQEHKRIEEYELRQKKHKEAIPQLTIDYIEKGHAILDQKYWKLWDECVPIRLDDLYQGMELNCCLDIVKILNEKDGSKFTEAHAVLKQQNHSGTSYCLLKSMVISFCDDGKQFYEMIGEQ